MTSAATSTAPMRTDWSQIWAQHGFRYFFFAMFISLFGSGMNVTGIGSAMYWANVNSLVQEVIPASQYTGANAAVLIGVQTGMLFAGAFVGFIYNRAGIAGILGIDGLTYFVSAWCLFHMRSGYISPRDHLAKYPHEFSEATEVPSAALESGEIPEVAEAGLSLAVYSDIKEGFAY